MPRNAAPDLLAASPVIKLRSGDRSLITTRRLPQQSAQVIHLRLHVILVPELQHTLQHMLVQEKDAPMNQERARLRQVHPLHHNAPPLRLNGLGAAVEEAAVRAGRGALETSLSERKGVSREATNTVEVALR